MDLTLLASYPKSGNTWTRFLLSHYFYGPSTEWMDINRVCLEMAYWLGVKREKDLTPEAWLQEMSETVSGFVRGQGHEVPEVLSRTVVLKAHQRFDATPWMTPLVGRCVYVLRHPKDTMLSNLNYCRMAAAPEHFQSEVAYAERYIEHKGDPRYFRHDYGTWHENAASYRDQNSVPVLMLKYEELRADPEGELAKIIRFLGEEPDQARLKAAVELSSFDRMRTMEEKARADGQLQEFRKGFQFMNKGGMGQKLKALRDDLDARFDEVFAPLGRDLGY